MPCVALITRRLYRSTIGFDHLFNLLDSATKLDAGQAYPPYNIERTGENEYRISVAVAGFSEADLEVEVKENLLSVRGSKSAPASNDNRQFLHQGIAGRSFERRFQLADHVAVVGAKLSNGSWSSISSAKFRGFEAAQDCDRRAQGQGARRQGRLTRDFP